MDFPSKKIMPRFSLVCLVFVLAGAALLGRALYVMTVEKEVWMLRKLQVTQNEHTMEPRRGDLLACDGRVLATMMPRYLVTVDFCTYEKDSLQRKKDQERRDTAYLNHADEICEGMHRLFPDINKTRYRAYLDSCMKARGKGCPIYPPEVSSLVFPSGQKKNKQLTYLELCEVRKLPLFKYRSSLRAVEVKLRNNPYGSLAYRTIGSFKDSARFGLELAYDSVLAGQPGKYHLEKVRNERIKRIDKPVVDGLDVMTTLDIDMQDLCKQVLTDQLTTLKADSGSCILMDVATGDVKAIVSLQDKEGTGNYIEHNPYAITAMFMPGSVFKACSFMVAMDDGRVKYDDVVDIQRGVISFGPNNLIRDDHVRAGVSGLRNVRQIIEESLNTGSALMIWNHYRNDPQAFVDGVNRVGLSADLQVPIEGYRKPYIASPNDSHRYWSNALDLPRLAIGYASQISPINLVTFYAGIANGGKLMYPRFVKGFMKNGQMVEEKPVRVLRQQMAKPEVITNLQDALRAVVQTGTAHAAGSKLVAFSGKTGTAQVYRNGHRIPGYYSITFVGFFPSEQPRYALIVNMQKFSPAYGNMCAHAFRQIAEHVMARENGRTRQPQAAEGRTTYPGIQGGNLLTTARTLQQLGIPFTTDARAHSKTPVWGYNDNAGGQPVLRQTKENVQVVPDVVGYGLRDAVYRLELLGLRVQVKGQGSVVLQSLPAGHTIKRGETITLTLGTRHNHKKGKPTPETPKAVEPDSTRHTSAPNEKDTKPEDRTKPSGKKA